MKRTFFIKEIIGIGICLLLLCSLLAIKAFSQGKEGVRAEMYLSDGDISMFSGDMDDARKLYEFVLKENPERYDALWRLSRFYVSRGMIAKKAGNKKKEWEKSAEYGRQAVNITPNGAEGHLYLAIALGKIAVYSPVSEKVKLVYEIKSEAEKAIELDPSLQKGYLALGAWHRKVATASSIERQLAKIFFGKLPNGSLEKSLQLLLKSVELGGTNVRNYYELAKTYEARGNYKAAKKEFKNGLSAAPFYPEDKELKQRIKEKLRKSRYN